MRGMMNMMGEMNKMMENCIRMMQTRDDARTRTHGRKTVVVSTGRTRQLTKLAAGRISVHLSARKLSSVCPTEITRPAVGYPPPDGHRHLAAAGLVVIATTHLRMAHTRACLDVVRRNNESKNTERGIGLKWKLASRNGSGYGPTPC
ncbi:hypothetical protein J2S34_003858 [Nitrobacter winogradskyi]|uniref:Uncharacterized protein n=1 Tax=Nitrobacter winogradskyi TaxID=913 RepID=A0ACC6AQH4_NITWI|nr:hypothetical protein [Nitrobacter winogradskyi]